MKLALMVVFATLAFGCGNKKTEPSTAGSAVGSDVASGSAGSAGSAVEPQGSGSAADAAGAGSAATGSSGPGSAAAGSAAGSAAAVEIDPRFAKLTPLERSTCAGYAACLIDNEKSELDNATPEQEAAIDAKKNGYINKCAAVWLELKPAEQKKLADCADQAGDCSSLKCFKPHKL